MLLLLRSILTQLLRSNIKTYENKSELPKKICHDVRLMRPKKQKRVILLNYINGSILKFNT